MYQRMPSCIDPVVVGVARDGRRGVLLMHDVGAHLVPEGDDPIPLEQHLRFLDHLATLHATFWGWEDDIGLTTDGIRYAMFGPSVVRVEAELGNDSAIPPLIGQGHERLRASTDPRRRDRPGVARRSGSAARRARANSAHVSPRRHEDGQPRQPARRPHDRDRLGLRRPGQADVGAHLVPRHQLGPAPAVEGSDDRGLSRRARTPRHRHRPVVGRADRARIARRVRAVRMGEGTRRWRRARVVGCPRRRRPSATSSE